MKGTKKILFELENSKAIIIELMDRIDRIDNSRERRYYRPRIRFQHIISASALLYSLSYAYSIFIK